MLKMIELKQIVIERALVIAYLFTESIALYSVLQTKSRSHFFVTFFIIRILFVTIALVFSYARLSKRYYFSGFREMPSTIYWRFVLLILFAMKALFLHRFIELSPFLQLIDLFFVTNLIISLLIFYQGQDWTIVPRKQSVDRINFLIGAKKARLSKEEFNAVKPILISAGRAGQRKSMYWIITEKFLYLIILAATIEAFASDIVNHLERKIPFLRNLLPPF